MAPLRVVIVKPSKYAHDGSVERFRRGFMPNSTIRHLGSLTPATIEGEPIRVEMVDEYVQTDLDYLARLAPERGERLLVAIAGVQSHQFHRALDLAVFATARGAMCVIGGPHAMTCDTTALHGRGVSFALAEAERVWPAILADARRGELRDAYGADRRWEPILSPPPLVPPTPRELKRYAVRMLGLYPARGCPFLCSFCSVIKIAGRTVRSQPVHTTIASLRAAKAVGVEVVMFTSDNFNKIPDVDELLDAMIDEKIELPFFAQCDAQVGTDPALVEKLARAGCYQMFVGVESFSKETLRAAKKTQNRPERYAEIAALCREHGIVAHFSNILGFPEDDEAAILEHLEALRALDPEIASFYVLTPIPGTEQYDDFSARGWITERDLDRFDGTSPTWTHPKLSPEALYRLLRRCYRDYYRAPDVLRRTARVFRGQRDFRRKGTRPAVPAYSLFSRLAVHREEHPMAGGILRVRRDYAADYIPARRARFGFELAPLPKSLALPEADATLVPLGAPPADA